MKGKRLQYQLYECKCIYRFVVFHLKDYFKMQYFFHSYEQQLHELFHQKEIISTNLMDS